MADSNHAPTPPPETPSWTPSTSAYFDIVHTYHSILTNDPLLTPPIAAIESLISLLSASPPSTASETLSLLSTASNSLKEGVPTRNSLAVTAGTDLFQRYIIYTLQARRAEKWDKEKWKHDSDFKAVRSHLLANSRLFLQRAKDARGGIARRAKRFVRDGTTVCTCGGRETVSAVLNAAADDGVRFRVIHIVADSDRTVYSARLADELRGKDIPVAVAPFEALATALQTSTFAMVGAENVVENGGVISGFGTFQMGLLAKSLGRPFYVVVESYKFVRFFPLGNEDLAGGGPKGALRFEGKHGEGEDRLEREKEREWGNEVDLTPSHLVTALVTEGGVQSPSAVSEELIKMWY